MSYATDRAKRSVGRHSRWTPLPDVPAALRGRLDQAGLDPRALYDLVVQALEEDLQVASDLPTAGTDVTSEATIPAGQRARAEFVCREDGVVAGLGIAELVMVVCDPSVVLLPAVADGSSVGAGTTLLGVMGDTRALLLAERTALNLLGHLSGIATATARWVAAVADSGAVIRDTRKTTPGLRVLEKYAVRCGGGQSHRMSLADAALVKDNHVLAAGGVVAAFEHVRRAYPLLEVEVEVDSVEEAVAAVEAGAALVLLDNFSLDELRRAVALVRGRSLLEASGGLRLDTAAAVAASGVDFLAVGALTHSAAALDIGLDFASVHGEV